MPFFLSDIIHCDLRQELLNILLPPSCLLCGQPASNERDLCSGCFKDLPNNSNACQRCGQSGYFDCSECETCQSFPPAFDRVSAPFLYQDAIRYLIKGLKFNHRYPHARLLGDLMAQALRHHEPFPECLIAVPLHRSRYRERGFNQSLEIARTLSKQLYIALDTDSCIRHRDTAHQVGLNAEQRRSNIHQAFTVTLKHPYQHVALVDDVITTGATVNELAKALKKAGVGRVDIWASARANVSDAVSAADKNGF